MPILTLRPDLYLDLLVFGAATTLPAANICKWFRGKRQCGKTSKLKKERISAAVPAVDAGEARTEPPGLKSDLGEGRTASGKPIQSVKRSVL